MDLISDDAVIAPTVVNNTLSEFFVIKFNSNGRFFTDVAANLFYRMPMTVWKVFDSLVYVAIAYLTSFVFTQRTLSETLTVCALIFAYPFTYLESAGYIATTTNYVYPVLALLIIALPFRQLLCGKKVSALYYILSLASILYATNHDQYAVVLIGGLVLLLLYAFMNKASKAFIACTAAHLAVSVGSYIFMFLTPGHINRMNNTAEMLRWLPQYENWTFMQKIYQGFSTTAANLIFNEATLFTVFCILLFAVSLIRKNHREMIIAAVPVGVVILSKIIGKENFVTTYSYSCNMPELLPVGAANNGFFAFLLSLLVLMLLLLSVYNCVEDKNNRWAIMILLLTAAASREMMGFSPTIYASSFRTFTFFIYALIFCCLLLLNELKKQLGNDNTAVKYIEIFVALFAVVM